MKQTIISILATLILGTGALYLVSCTQVSQATVYKVVETRAQFCAEEVEEQIGESCQAEIESVCAKRMMNECLKVN